MTATLDTQALKKLPDDQSTDLVLVNEIIQDLCGIANTVVKLDNPVLKISHGS